MTAKRKNIPLSEEAFCQAADCLKTIAHPARLKMIQMMLSGRHTVGELADACGIQSHMASEHLRLMQHCNLLHSEREGRRIYYRVAEPHLESIVGCIEHRFAKVN